MRIYGEISTNQRKFTARFRLICLCVKVNFRQILYESLKTVWLHFLSVREKCRYSTKLVLLITTMLHLTRQFADYRLGFSLDESSWVSIGSASQTESVRVMVRWSIVFFKVSCDALLPNIQQNFIRVKVKFRLYYIYLLAKFWFFCIKP